MDGVDFIVDLKTTADTFNSVHTNVTKFDQVITLTVEEFKKRLQLSAEKNIYADSGFCIIVKHFQAIFRLVFTCNSTRVFPKAI
ncbi:hypothetical protein MTR_4g051608 [Medicago truncatula]|uniref:Uncharacterized protein n=1 Tax=Medicago truncatula TaxID=3880 RepID=A0A072UK47_MEDTR|nr:hypothetical protein MTR_4g051608 [Medicago truncatula]